jgi:hypothetical protein
MTYRRLKFFVPILQVLLALGLFLWHKFPHSEFVNIRYVEPAWDIVIFKLNFPVVAFWSPIVYVMERWPEELAPSSTTMQISVAMALGLAMLSSIGFFWYLVIAELECRVHGRSMIRFANWFAETCKALILFTVGGSALAYAFFETKRLLLYDRSKADMLVGGLFLAAWGVVLVSIPIVDAVVSLRKQAG